MENNCLDTKTLQGKLYYDGKVMVDYKIEYPQSRLDTAPGIKFNSFNMLQAKTTERRAKTVMYRDAVKQYIFAEMNGFPFFNYELLQQFTTTLCDFPFLSLYYEQYEYTGGAHGNTVKAGETWNLNTGEYYDNLGKLFVKGYAYKPVIIKNVTEQAKQRQQMGEVDYFENLEENIVQYFDEKNFYLTPRALAVYYPLYSIAPYVAGIQVFEIPYTEFGGNIIYKPSK